MARKRPEPKTLKGQLSRIIASHFVVTDTDVRMNHHKAASELLDKFYVIPKANPPLELVGLPIGGGEMVQFPVTFNGEFVSNDKEQDVK